MPSRSTLLLLLLPALLALGPSATAQCTENDRTVQPVDLKVRLWYTNGRPVTERERIQLLNSLESYVGEVFSDNQGEADFRVSPGSYVLRISGPNVEDTTTPVFRLLCNEGTHFENVDVKMKAGSEAGSESTVVSPAAPGSTVAAVDLNVPDKAHKEFEKGSAALQHNDLAAARKAFEKAIQIYPQYAGAYNNLGLIAMKSGDRAAALAAFQQAVRINDHYPLACINLARLLLPDKKYSEAQELLSRALSTDPLNLDALTMLADVQLETAHYDQAINTAWKVHSMPHEGYSVVHIMAALAFEARHMPQEAAVEYATYLKESPNGPAAQRAAAALAKLQNQGP